MPNLLSRFNTWTLVNPKEANQKNFVYFAKKAVSVFKQKLGNFWDPEVIFTVANRDLRLNFAHRFPGRYSQWPDYDRALPRLCDAVKKYFGTLRVIDVGANVGDTVNLIVGTTSGSFLLIEPSPKYFSFLRQNTQGMPSVYLDQTLLGDQPSSTASLRVVEHGGTAHVVEGSSSATVKTLDEVIREKYTEFAEANVVKVDTDGFDYKVIRGASQLLAESKPILFFEFAPGCLRSVGEDPRSIFSFLHSHGYTDFVFYDETGTLLFACHGESEMEFGTSLIDYAASKPAFEMDVVAFHEKFRALSEQFYKSEREKFGRDCKFSTLASE